MERARCNTELYSLINNPSNFLGSLQNHVSPNGLNVVRIGLGSGECEVVPLGT